MSVSPSMGTAASRALDERGPGPGRHLGLLGSNPVQEIGDRDLFALAAERLGAAGSVTPPPPRAVFGRLGEQGGVAPGEGSPVASGFSADWAARGLQAAPRAAVTTVLPTSVSVPVMKRLRVMGASRWRGARAGSSPRHRGGGGVLQPQQVAQHLPGREAVALGQVGVDVGDECARSAGRQPAGRRAPARCARSGAGCSPRRGHRRVMVGPCREEDVRREGLEGFEAGQVLREVLPGGLRTMVPSPATMSPATWAPSVAQRWPGACPGVWRSRPDPDVGAQHLAIAHLPIDGEADVRRGPGVGQDGRLSRSEGRTADVVAMVVGQEHRGDPQPRASSSVRWSPSCAGRHPAGSTAMTSVSPRASSSWWSQAAGWEDTYPADPRRDRVEGSALRGSARRGSRRRSRTERDQDDGRHLRPARPAGTPSGSRCRPGCRHRGEEVEGTQAARRAPPRPRRRPTGPASSAASPSAASLSAASLSTARGPRLRCRPLPARRASRLRWPGRARRRVESGVVVIGGVCIGRRDRAGPCRLASNFVAERASVSSSSAGPGGAQAERAAFERGTSSDAASASSSGRPVRGRARHRTESGSMSSSLGSRSGRPWLDATLDRGPFGGSGGRLGSPRGGRTGAAREVRLDPTDEGRDVRAPADVRPALSRSRTRSASRWCGPRGGREAAREHPTDLRHGAPVGRARPTRPERASPIGSGALW